MNNQNLFFRNKIRLVLLILPITALWISFFSPSAAIINSNSWHKNTLNNSDIFSLRKIESPINIENFSLNLEIIPQKTDLIKASIRLRNIARFLGSKWPIIVSITEQNQDNIYKKTNNTLEGFKITDWKISEGNWTTLTAGHALNLVSQELEILNNSKEQPLIDLLIRDDISNNYRPLLNIPLSTYCYLLLDAIQPKNKK